MVLSLPAVGEQPQPTEAEMEFGSVLVLVDVERRARQARSGDDIRSRDTVSLSDRARTLAALVRRRRERVTAARPLRPTACDHLGV